jgi:glycolate oxidase FAD binding subunit
MPPVRLIALVPSCDLPLRPETPEQLAGILADAAREGRTIALDGASSKRRFGGAVAGADVEVSTTAMRRILRYEPGDLTVSVEAGVPYTDLAAELARNRQMLPLDPPFAARATVGGVVAANSSGPRRRLYGTARDHVIGMRFATLEGKLVQSGGMVVKNVAGLDMAKLMIGSFGTLAAIAVVNLRVHPMPARSRTFLLAFDEARAALAARDRLLGGALPPAALDLLNPAAAMCIGRSGWLLAAQAQGNRGVVDRFAAAFQGAETLEDEAETSFWETIREFTPSFLDDHPGGAVVRLSATLHAMEALLVEITSPVVARSANGVAYAHFAACAGAQACLRGRRGVIESAPPGQCEPWPEPGGDFSLMKRIKTMLDPETLLNRGRLYGRI